MGGVSDILGKAYGQKLDRLSAAYKGIGAFLGTSKYAQYYKELAECFTYHGSPMTRDELKNLPAGCVVFGDQIPGGTGDGALYGHAFITVGDGKHAICDHYEDLTRMNTKYYVFYPNGKKLKST